MGAVDDFLTAVELGKGGEIAHLYTDDAVVDTTVPMWRFTTRGGAAIAEQFAGWFAHPAEFAEFDRHKFGNTEYVTYFLRWQADGIDYAAHHSHAITVDETTGLIVSDRVFCGGGWDGELLGRMEAEERARAGG
jgi:ketosteroid isomerase-like protein